MKNHIKSNLDALQTRIQTSARQHSRNPGDITLIAVSKKHDCESIRYAHSLGLTAFGENYIQELEAKQAQLRDLELEWHFIGSIQSNKTQKISEYCTWVHTVSRLSIAQRLSKQRSSLRAPINCCIQYNINRDPNKAGVTSDQELFALAELIQTLPNVSLRGLMTMPENNQAQRQNAYAQLTKKLRLLQDKFPESPIDTLSMGMSADIDIAIQEGATMLRVGTALFGTRAM